MHAGRQSRKGVSPAHEADRNSCPTGESRLDSDLAVEVGQEFLDAGLGGARPTLRISPIRIPWLTNRPRQSIPQAEQWSFLQNARNHWAGPGDSADSIIE